MEEWHADTPEALNFGQPSNILLGGSGGLSK